MYTLMTQGPAAPQHRFRVQEPYTHAKPQAAASRGIDQEWQQWLQSALTALASGSSQQWQQSAVTALAVISSGDMQHAFTATAVEDGQIVETMRVTHVTCSSCIFTHSSKVHYKQVYYCRLTTKVVSEVQRLDRSGGEKQRQSL